MLYHYNLGAWDSTPKIDNNLKLRDDIMLNPFLGIAFKLLVKATGRLNIYPTGFYVKRALSSVRTDDLDAAIEYYQRAAAKDFGNEKVKVLREILASEIRHRKKLLTDRKSAPESDSDNDECEKGVRLLDGFLVRLGYRAGESQTVVSGRLPEVNGQRIEK